MQLTNYTIDPPTPTGGGKQSHRTYKEIKIKGKIMEKMTGNLQKHVFICCLENICNKARPKKIYPAIGNLFSRLQLVTIKMVVMVLDSLSSSYERM